MPAKRTAAPARPGRTRRPAPRGNLLADVGQRIRRLREHAGLSQTQLGKPHFTRAGISAIEMGKSAPALRSLAFLAERLGVTAQELVPDEVDPEDKPLPKKMPRKTAQVLHERAVVFSTAKFLRAKGLVVRRVRRGDESQQQPDGLFDSKNDLNTEGTIGIEVGCVGYGEPGTPEAAAPNRAIWNIATGDYDEQDAAVIPMLTEDDVADPAKALAKLDAVPLMMNFDSIVAYAQRILDKKNARPYSVPTILVIDAASEHVGLTTAQEGLRIASQINLPDPCSFLRIYLRMRHNASFEYEFVPLHIREPNI